MTENLFLQVTEWQKETFPTATSLSKLHHLGGKDPEGEIGELITDIKLGKSEKGMSMPTALCCFLALPHLMGCRTKIFRMQ